MSDEKLSNFLGLNTRLPDFSLRPRDARTKDGLATSGRFLRVADNVDIDDNGCVRRRGATALQQAMTGAHSLKMLTETTGFLVRDSVLYAITLPDYTETLLKLLTSNARMNYVQFGGSWYFSNGTDAGRITEDAVYPIGLPTPAIPTTSTIGGDLLRGTYQVKVSYANTSTGEEGGVPEAAVHELADTGGIRVTLPGATTGATHINVYLSAANGSAPTLAVTVPTGTALVDLTTLATGREVSVRDEIPLPAGTLFLHNGCLNSFAGNTLYLGVPFRPGYTMTVGGYIPFPATVTNAVSNQSGAYIAADKTYFVPGDLSDVKGDIKDVLPYGGVAGTEFATEDGMTVGWFGAKGFVLVTPEGGLTTPMSDNIDVTAPTIGATGVYDYAGLRKVVSCGYCMNLTTGAATTYSDWSFTSLSGCYGTKPDGIYLTDAIGAVNATVGLGKINFGSEGFKGLPAVYLGINATAPMSLRVQAPSAVDYTYAARSASTDLRIQRIDPGKGLRASWFELTISNTLGADFSLASVTFTPTTSTRRI